MKPITSLKATRLFNTIVLILFIVLNITTLLLMLE
jgi:hypothetical protein